MKDIIDLVRAAALLVAAIVVKAVGLAVRLLVIGAIIGALAFVSLRLFEFLNGVL